MNQTTKNVRELTVAYIGGGSRGWAWGFMKDLALDGEICGTVRLYDIDREAAERNRIIGEKISAHPDTASRWAYKVSNSLQEALTGADFVVISILPGTLDEMESDVHLPERLGIWQPVGDTVGAGGFMRAMRTIPMFVTIGEAIRDYAPEAWVINYTNPMSLCVRTLYEVFPEIRAFGCCHEVFGTQKLLCSMLKTEEGIDGVKRQDLYTTVTGINHFTWLTSATWQGRDLFPLYARFVEKYAESGYDEGGDDNWMNSHFNCAQLRRDRRSRRPAPGRVCGSLVYPESGNRPEMEIQPDPRLLAEAGPEGTAADVGRPGQRKEGNHPERFRGGRPPAAEGPARPRGYGVQCQHPQPRPDSQPAPGRRCGNQRPLRAEPH